MVRTELDISHRPELQVSGVSYGPYHSLFAAFKVASTPGLRYTRPVGKEAYAGQHYPDELRLREILSSGTPMLIPRLHLFGRQSAESYDQKKRVLAERELKEKGIRFLLAEPIIACALPMPEGLQIVIIDGHHRTRYSGRFGIHKIPSLVYSPEQLMPAFNMLQETYGTADDLVTQLERDTQETLQSFSHLPDAKIPTIVPGCQKPEDLPFARFQPLTAT